MDLMTSTLPPIPADVPEELLLEDFKQQCTNLQGQYTRMHNRLQLLVGLNTALLPALGAVLAASAGKGGIDRNWLILFPCAGLLLSVIGYITGATDRKLVTIYRRQLALTAELLLVAHHKGQSAYQHWFHIGRDPTDVEKYLAEWRPKSPPRLDWVTSWRSGPLSVTRLPALLSLVLVAIWAVILALLCP
jgi:hypothetical protein